MINEPSSPAVEVHGLTRDFLRRHGRQRSLISALSDVSLEVPYGEIHGLLGPNGAGKTTLVKILSTVLLPTSGSAFVCGYNVASSAPDVRRLIGMVLGGEKGLYPRLTARRMLSYAGSLQGLNAKASKDRAAILLQLMGLSSRADDRIETYSRGMKQRLHLARGIMANPRVLFLDEPTSGLDPVVANEIRALVTDLKQKGCTVLLTTHDMAEAAQLCDRVTFLKAGKVVATETPKVVATLVSRYERIDVGGAALGRVRLLVATLPGIDFVTALNDGWIRIHTLAEGSTAHVLRALVDAGLTTIRTSYPSLEEVFLHHYSRQQVVS